MIKKKILIGLLFISIGTLFLVSSYSYNAGTLANMGPAFLPKAVSVLLITLGILTFFKNDR